MIGLSLPLAMARLAETRRSGADRAAGRCLSRIIGARSRPTPAESRCFPAPGRRWSGCVRATTCSLALRPARAWAGVASHSGRTDDIGDYFVDAADARPQSIQAASGHAADAPCARPARTRTQTVMIGDTTFDIEMARAAGVAPIGVILGLSRAADDLMARRCRHHDRPLSTSSTPPSTQFWSTSHARPA